MNDKVCEAKGVKRHILALRSINKSFDVCAITSHCTGEGGIYKGEYHGVYHEDHGNFRMQAVPRDEISDRTQDSKEQAATW